MSTDDSKDESTTSESAPPEAALDHVVDDLTPKEECADWIALQMRAGRTSEAILADMVADGWDEDEAMQLVEFVRRETRHERGVVTREEVVQSANRRYRQSWAPSWFSGIPLLSSAFRLIGSLGSLALFRRLRDKPPSE